MKISPAMDLSKNSETRTFFFRCLDLLMVVGDISCAALRNAFLVHLASFYAMNASSVFFDATESIKSFTVIFSQWLWVNDVNRRAAVPWIDHRVRSKCCSLTLTPRDAQSECLKQKRLKRDEMSQSLCFWDVKGMEDRQDIRVLWNAAAT